jgi:hypothetical protein
VSATFAKLDARRNLGVRGVGAVKRICEASLERQHLAVPHDLATPDPARFAAPQRAGKALEPDRAGGAQRLRPFEVRR